MSRLELEWDCYDFDLDVPKNEKHIQKRKQKRENRNTAS